MEKQVSVFVIFLLVIFSVISSCTESEKNKDWRGGEELKSLFERLDPGKSSIKFVNELTETEELNYFTFEYIYNGGGVAAGDINNDGLTDIYFSGNQVSCHLYLNKGNLKFEDITLSSGTRTEGWCTGVSIADINADGWLDIYVCRSSSKLGNAEERRNLLFINNRNLTFTESAKQFGIDDAGYSTQAYFFDADNDEDLDLYLVNHRIHFELKIIGMEKENSIKDDTVNHKFYLNTGKNSFTDRTKYSGLLSYSFGLSAAIADINRDGYADIYASNDYNMPDFIYINNGDATFRDETDLRLDHMSEFSMGSDIADFNNDGFYDIITLDMLPEDVFRHKMLFMAQNYDKYKTRVANGYRHQRMQNCLQLNHGDGTFSDIALMAGVARTDWSWAPLFVDLDNDGWKDLFITTGYLRDVTNLDFTVYRMQEERKSKGMKKATKALLDELSSTPLKNYAFRNTGDLSFSDHSEIWGLSDPGFSNGAAYADLDNDGDVDLVVNNVNDTAGVYINNSSSTKQNNFLKVKLKGSGRNTQGIGAEVTIYSGGKMQCQQLYPVRGFISSADYTLNFGLGKKEFADSLLISWNQSKHQILKSVKCNQTITLNIENSISGKIIHKLHPEPEVVFVKANDKYKINFKHTENSSNDFKLEPMLPHEFSRLGPNITTGDINNDGLEDFFIGNAKGSAGMMYVQQPGGTFKPNTSQPWQADKNKEDTGCLLFDADSDNDLDLYVVSGGSEESAFTDYYQDRLYINKGKGVFHKCADCLPVTEVSGSCVVAADFDSDGDMDLFRGSRNAPLIYPLPVNSYLLRNDGGKFTDVITDAALALHLTGIVNAAVWADFNNDSKPDLAVAGEWMPIMLFENRDGKLVWINNHQEGKNTSGWWLSLAAADMDGDSDIDFVAGNYGLNLKLNASKERPLMLFAKDFDSNSTLDAILCNYSSDGKSYPIYSRDDITDQIRPMKKELLRYSDFAGKTIEEIFGKERLQDARVFNCYNLSSCYIENAGDGNFIFHALPKEAQAFPAYGIIIEDFNKDNKKDILMAGNSFSESVELGYCDAGRGLLLIGNGKGTFQVSNSPSNGLLVKGDTKHLQKLALQNGKSEIVLIAKNNSLVEVYEFRQKAKE